MHGTFKSDFGPLGLLDLSWQSVLSWLCSSLGHAGSINQGLLKYRAYYHTAIAATISHILFIWQSMANVFYFTTFELIRY